MKCVRKRIVFLQAAILFFTEQFVSKARFDQLYFGILHDAVKKWGVFKKIYRFSSGYFQNGGHKNTLLEQFVENFLNNGGITVFFTSRVKVVLDG